MGPHTVASRVRRRKLHARVPGRHRRTLSSACRLTPHRSESGMSTTTSVPIRVALTGRRHGAPSAQEHGESPREARIPTPPYTSLSRLQRHGHLPIRPDANPPPQAHPRGIPKGRRQSGRGHAQRVGLAHRWACTVLGCAAGASRAAIGVPFRAVGTRGRLAKAPAAVANASSVTVRASSARARASSAGARAPFTSGEAFDALERLTIRRRRQFLRVLRAFPSWRRRWFPQTKRISPYLRAWSAAVRLDAPAASR